MLLQQALLSGSKLGEDTYWLQLQTLCTYMPMVCIELLVSES
jgi:hypothetical protein